MRQFEISIVDSIGTLLQALCEIVSSNGYLARLVPDVAQRKNKTIEQKSIKRERERGEEERTCGRRDRGAGALFLWEDPMHNLDSRAQV